MEFTKEEVLEVMAVVGSLETDVKELNDLQMALVGGGAGDPVAY
jgi:hypothetical protein